MHEPLKPGAGSVRSEASTRDPSSVLSQASRSPPASNEFGSVRGGVRDTLGPNKTSPNLHAEAIEKSVSAKAWGAVSALAGGKDPVVRCQIHIDATSTTGTRDGGQRLCERQHARDHWELQLRFWESEQFIIDGLCEYMAGLMLAHQQLQQQVQRLQAEGSAKDNVKDLSSSGGLPEKVPRTDSTKRDRPKLLERVKSFSRQFVDVTRAQVAALQTQERYRRDCVSAQRLLTQLCKGLPWSLEGTKGKELVTDALAKAVSSSEQLLSARDDLSADLREAYWERDAIVERLCEAEAQLASEFGGGLASTSQSLDPWVQARVEDKLMDCLQRGVFAAGDLQSISAWWEGGGRATAVIHLGREFKTAQIDEMQTLVAKIFDVPRESVEVRDVQPGSTIVIVSVVVAAVIGVIGLGLLCRRLRRCFRRLTAAKATVARPAPPASPTELSAVRTETDLMRFLQLVTPGRTTGGLLDPLGDPNCIAAVVSGPGKSPTVFNLLLEKCMEHAVAVAMVYFPGRDETTTELSWAADWGQNVGIAHQSGKQFVVLTDDEKRLGATQRLEKQFLLRHGYTFRDLTVKEFLEQFCGGSCKHDGTSISWTSPDESLMLKYESDGVRTEKRRTDTGDTYWLQIEPLTMTLTITRGDGSPARTHQVRRSS